jgi:hypothetical protein
MTEQADSTPPFVLPFTFEACTHRIVLAERMLVERLDGLDALGNERWNPKLRGERFSDGFVEAIVEAAANRVRGLDVQVEFLEARLDTLEDSLAPASKIVGAIVVMINGRLIEVHDKTLSYGTILAIVRQSHASVTWKGKSGSGILSEGQSIDVEPGLVINAHNTSNA